MFPWSRTVNISGRNPRNAKFGNFVPQKGLEQKKFRSTGVASVIFSCCSDFPLADMRDDMPYARGMCRVAVVLAVLALQVKLRICGSCSMPAR